VRRWATAGRGDGALNQVLGDAVGSWPRSFWPLRRAVGRVQEYLPRCTPRADTRALPPKWPQSLCHKGVEANQPYYPRWHAGRTGAGFSGVAPGAPTAPAGASAVRSPGRLAATGLARIFILLRPGAGARPGGEVIDNTEALPAPRRDGKKAQV
jgi:hypothetical protein